MTLQEYIIQVVFLYKKASETKADSTKIRRGRSHSVASEAEDLFADLLITNDDDIAMIRVDQPITIPTDAIEGKKSFQVYPDIVIIKNGQVKALIDLKMDLGWNRDGLVQTCERHFRTVSLASGKIGKLKDGQTKDKQEVIFSVDLTYSVVIVSGTNINQEKLEHQVSLSNSISESVRVHVLSNGLHPNGYWRSCTTDQTKLEINEHEFDDLLERIK